MVRMTNAERQKKYRERKKLKEGGNYMKKETERVKKYYVPTVELNARKLALRREKIKICMQKRRYTMNETGAKHISSPMSENQSGDDKGPCDSTVPDTSMVEPCSSTMIIKMNFPPKTKKHKANTKLQYANKKLKSLNEKMTDLQRRNACLRKKVERLQTASQKGKAKGKHVTESNRQELTPKSKTKQQLRDLNMTPSSKKKIFKRLHFQNCLESEIRTIGSKTQISKHWLRVLGGKIITPKSKTKQQLRDLNMTPSSKKKIFKRLHFQNCLESEIRTIGSKTQISKHWLRVLGGKIIQKYKMNRKLATYTGVDRRRFRRASKSTTERTERQPEKRRNLERIIVEFMERDDVSTCLPGRKDSKKVGKIQIQKRVLDDYLYNLHLKFKAENGSSNISLTTFSRLRPKNIQLVQFCNRKTCLCQRHQNMALKCKALREYKVISTDSPDVLTEKMNDAEIMNSIESVQENRIKFSEWQRVTVLKKGKEFKRMQIVNIDEAKDDFVRRMTKDLDDFRNHIQRVKAQYEQSRSLKRELPDNHVICHMDFAENYSCSFANEIQTAYFDKSTVTLHPVVVYFRDDATGEVKHKSNVIVSNETAHIASTVFAIMKKIVEEVKVILPSCKMIHYMTDSPTSQYRNRQIFSIVANHDKLFPDIQAAWLYFEAGHGKGPCDGVGGTAKRLADMAVRRHKTVIQNADFFDWGKGQECSDLKYIFVDKSECADAQDDLSKMMVKPIKGTLLIHAVVPLGNGGIATRETSCYCTNCFSDGKFQTGCPGWRTQVLVSEKDNASHIPDESAISEIEPSPEVNAVSQSYAVDTYVAAMYNNNWYMAHVLKYDDTDGEYYISFMVESKNSSGHLRRIRFGFKKTILFERSVTQ